VLYASPIAVYTWNASSNIGERIRQGTEIALHFVSHVAGAVLKPLLALGQYSDGSSPTWRLPLSRVEPAFVLDQLSYSDMRSASLVNISSRTKFRWYEYPTFSPAFEVSLPLLRADMSTPSGLGFCGIGTEHVVALLPSCLLPVLDPDVCSIPTLDVCTVHSEAIHFVVLDPIAIAPLLPSFVYGPPGPYALPSPCSGFDLLPVLSWSGFPIAWLFNGNATFCRWVRVCSCMFLLALMTAYYTMRFCKPHQCAWSSRTFANMIDIIPGHLFAMIFLMQLLCLCHSGYDLVSGM
jgi:hypothetical protein